MKAYFITIIFVVLFFTEHSHGQGYPFITSDIETIASASTQNWSIAQDRKGYIYIANTSGILFFNGNSWQLYKLPNQQTVRFLYRAKNDTIYVGGQNEFGYLLNNSKGSLEYKSLVFLVPEKHRAFEDVWEIFKVDTSIFIRTSKAILYKHQSADSFSIIQTKSRFDRSYLVEDKFYVKESGRGIFLFGHSKLEQLAGTDFFNEMMVMSFVPNRDKFIIATAKNGFFKLDKQSGLIEKVPISETLSSFLKEYVLYRFLQLDKGRFAIGTTRNGLIITDSLFSNCEYLNEGNGLSDNLVIDLFEDNQANLWSINGNNFSIINHQQPWLELGANDGLEGAAYSSVFYRDKYFVGGSSGLFLYENGRLARYQKVSRQVWSFYPTDEMLYIAYRSGLYTVDKELDFVNLSDNMWGVISHNNETKKMLVGTYGAGIVSVTHNGKKWKYNTNIKGYEESTRFFEVDKNGFVWISQPSRGVDRLKIDLDNDTVVQLDNYGINKGFLKEENNYVFQIDNNGQKELVFATMDGIYLYDYNNDTIVKHPDFINTLDSLETDLFNQDTDGNIWFQCFRNETYYKGYLYKNANNEYAKIDTPFFRLKEIYTESFTFSKDKVALNTSEGVFFYLKNQNEISFEHFSSNISSFYLDSTLVYEAPGLLEENYLFEPNFKTIKFNYGALYFEEMESIEYRYKLDGFDDNWSDWTKLKFKEYTNLPKGNFSFRVQARNIYEQQSNDVAINFSIEAAWYNTILAYILYFLVFVGFMALIVKFYTFKLKQDKIRLENIVKERTYELNQQKEELLVIAENLKESNSLILEKNGELGEANIKIATRNKKITDSLNYALTIQSAMLPQIENLNKFFSDSFILFKPRDIVSGDFYWTREFDDKIVVVAADCTGHGVPGGFMSMLGIAFLNEIVISEESLLPNNILDQLRSKVKKVFEHSKAPTEQLNGMDLSLIIFDKSNLKVQFSGANNSIYVIKNTSKDVIKYKADRQPIGNYRKEFPFSLHEIILDKGDWIYMFSDGFQDQLGEKTKKRYKSNNFVEFLLSKSDKIGSNQLEDLEIEFNKWRGTYSQIDDVLVIGVQV